VHELLALARHPELRRPWTSSGRPSHPRAAAIGALAILAAGCTVGGNAAEWPVAHRPEGVTVSAITRGGSTVQMELLSVEDTALVLYGTATSGAQRVVRLPLRQLLELDVTSPSIHVSTTESISPRDLSRLRRVSRFPQGLSPEVLARLLAASQQDSVMTVGYAADRSADLAAAVRAASAVYRHRTRALEAGYRAVGPDAPGMGQHWIQPGLLVRDTVDPARPPILMYATIGGRPVLVAVAFAHPGGPPPASEGGAIPPGAWHTHGASVEQEAIVPSHALGLGESARAPRLGVVHVWAWVENRAGLFVPNNWDLPYLRAGLVPPATVDVAAARALSLAFTGAAYLEDQLRTFGQLRPTAEGEALASVGASAGRVRAWLAGRKEGPVTAAEQSWLRGQWRLLGDSLESRLASGPRRRLAPVLDAGDGHRRR
jgi:hypothetical protein